MHRGLCEASADAPRPVVAASSAACASSAVSEAGDGGQPACVSCHMPEYLSAAHHPGKKPTECGVCHAQEGWHPSRLDYAWPLTGSHAKADCFACHKGDAAGLPRHAEGVLDCHRHDYCQPARTTRSPDHVSGVPRDHGLEACVFGATTQAHPRGGPATVPDARDDGGARSAPVPAPAHSALKRRRGLRPSTTSVLRRRAENAPAHPQVPMGFTARRYGRAPGFASWRTFTDAHAVGARNRGRARRGGRIRQHRRCRKRLRSPRD